MAGRSVKRNRQRTPDAQVTLPTPSITLDVAMPTAGGGVDQQRPAFNDFDKAAKALASFKTMWTKQLAAHRKLARAQK